MKNLPLLLLAPPLFGFVVVAFFGVNFPKWDEWFIPLYMESARLHLFSLNDLWLLHNEHRIVFPKLIYLASGFLTDFNVKVNMFLSWGFNCGLYALMLLYLRRTIAGKKMQVTFGVAIGFCCCFNLVQFENILWGFQVGFVMVAFFSVACFYCFDRWLGGGDKKMLALSLVCGVVASFSSLQGLFVWPTMLLLLSLTGQRKRLLYLLFFSVLILGLYFYDYLPQSDLENQYTSNVLQVLKAFFITIGAPFAANYCVYTHGEVSAIFVTADLLPKAIFFGVLLFVTACALVLHLYKQRKLNQYVFPLCLLFFSGIFACSIAAGRGGSVSMIASSRYTTFTLLGFVGIAIILAREVIPRVQKWIPSVLFFLFLVLFVQNSLLFDLPKNKELRLEKAQAFTDYTNESKQKLHAIDSLLNQCPIGLCISILEDNKWSVFAK